MVDYNDSFSFMNPQLKIQGSDGFKFDTKIKPLKTRRTAKPAPIDNSRGAKPFSKFTGNVTGDEMISLLGKFGHALNPDNAYGRVGAVAANFADSKIATRAKAKADQEKQDRLIDINNMQNDASMSRVERQQEGQTTRAKQKNLDSVKSATTLYNRGVKDDTTAHGREMEKIKLRNLGKKGILEYVDKQLPSFVERENSRRTSEGKALMSEAEVMVTRQRLRSRKVQQALGREPVLYQGKVVYVDKKGLAFDEWGNPMQAKKKTPAVSQFVGQGADGSMKYTMPQR